MHLFTAFLLTALPASSVSAASYQKTDGTIVDPIMSISQSSPIGYSGNNLEPDADLANADLHDA